MLDSFKLTESRTDNPDVSEFVDDVVGPLRSNRKRRAVQRRRPDPARALPRCRLEERYRL